MTVDDQAVFRSVAREVIEATPGFRSVGEAASGEDALDLVDAFKPQLVLVDVRMPTMNGVETARRLTELHPELVIVLISLEDRADVQLSDDGSAAAFVRKQDFGPSLLCRLWSTHGGATGA